MEYKVKLLGAIADQQLASYYAACDIFCLPSIYRSEAYGIVQVEAMSFAKPIISCDIAGSGVSWVNEHEKSGLLVPPSNPQALADAINKLSQDDALRNKMAIYARKRFEQELTAESMVNKTIKMYSKSIFASAKINIELFNPVQSINELAPLTRAMPQKEEAN